MKKAARPPTDPELKRRIQELIDYRGGGHNEENVADINTGPPIKRIKATPEEVADDDRMDLPRIAFHFNRKDYGRLRQLIDVRNGV